MVLPAAPAEPAPAGTVHTIVIAGAEQANRAIELFEEFHGFEVVNKLTHQTALVGLKEAKVVKRGIAAHWKRITTAVDTVKADAKAAQLKEETPATDIVTYLDKVTRDYDDAATARAQQQEREAAADKLAKATAERARDLQAQLDEAERLEATSPKISARELCFVETWAGFHFDPTRAGAAAKVAEYKDPHDERTIERILRRQPVVDYIAIKKQTTAMRRQIEAQLAQPVSVVTEEVEPEVGYVSGLARVKNYKCDEDSLDLVALWAGVIAGTVDRGVFVVSMPFLNKEADRLKEKFEQVYPMCRLKNTESTRG